MVLPNGNGSSSSLSDLAENPKNLELYVSWQTLRRIIGIFSGLSLYNSFARTLSPMGCQHQFLSTLRLRDDQ